MTLNSWFFYLCHLSARITGTSLSTVLLYCFNLVIWAFSFKFDLEPQYPVSGCDPNAGDEVPIGSVPGPKKLNPLFFTDSLLPTFKVCMSEIQASRHRPSAASPDHSLPLCPDSTWSYTYAFLHASLILSGFCHPAQPSHTWWCGWEKLFPCKQRFLKSRRTTENGVITG